MVVTSEPNNGDTVIRTDKKYEHLNNINNVVISK